LLRRLGNCFRQLDDARKADENTFAGLFSRFFIDRRRPGRYDTYVSYAYVSTNLLDLWNQPRFNSERLSQLFFGEVVSLGKTAHDYVRVTQTDGYTGWADIRFLRRVRKSQVELYMRLSKYVVTTERARLVGEYGQISPCPHFLYYGTTVCFATLKGELKGILPDGALFQLRANCAKPVGVKPPTGSQVVREARRFLGVPYLWGGISPAGFDCSGLVRTVLGRFGVYVPRDTKDQIKIGAEIKRNDIRTGDLLFFKRHVGFAIGHDLIIHSSAGGSGVRINSLSRSADDYRPDLDRDFVTARRIL
jgi:hypothetical protein